MKKQDKKGDWNRQTLHDPNSRPGASAMELHGNSRGATNRHQSDPQAPGLTAARLNATQPPLPRQVMGQPPNQGRPNGPGLASPRSPAGGYMQAAPTPTGSTQAQFQNSAQNLPQRPMTQSPQMNSPAQPQNSPQQPQPTGFQKFMKTLCCG
jgi:casein kinase 1